VERKISDAQAQERILKILKDYEKKYGVKPRSICFCLTPSLCDAFSSFFNNNGIRSGIFIGDDDKDYTGIAPVNRNVTKVTQTQGERQKVLAQFKNKQLQVICATGALGRGVHLDGGVRFAFFPIVPLSLNNYIQQSGRVGRDGKLAHIYLFYRDEDLHKARGILRYKKDKMEEGLDVERNTDPLLDVKKVSFTILEDNIFHHSFSHLVFMLTVCFGWYYLPI
jgi:superfamily II DNA helicase RecQ